jgi:hypothetical protein
VSKPTTVTAGLNFTRNLRDFENVKLHVEVTDSVRDNENVNQAFERVYKFVEEKLIEKVRAIEEEIKGQK